MTVNTRTSELYITNWTSSSTQKWKFSNWHESQLPGGEIISKYGNYHLTVVGNKIKALSWDGSFAQKWSCYYPDTPFFQKNLHSSSTPVYVPVSLYFICIAHLNICSKFQRNSSYVIKNHCFVQVCILADSGIFKNF